MMRTLVLVAALLMVGNVSAAQIETDSAPVRMHFHINGFQDFIINTQPVGDDPDSYKETQAFGLATSSMCADNPAAPGLTNRGYQTWYSYHSPSHVQYDVDESGKPRIYQERGLAADVRIDVDAPSHLDWYVVPARQGTSMPSLLPMVLEVTMREGDDVSVGNSAMNEGTIIATARSDAVILEPSVDHPQVSHHVVDGLDVYGFHVPLTYQQDTISRAEGFNVRIDLYADEPICDGDHGMSPVQHAAHTSPGLRPGMDWSIFDAIRIDALHPQFVKDEFVIHTGALSPFGYGDVGSVGLSIPGAVTPPEQVEVVRHCQHSHGGCDPGPRTGAWLWNYTTSPEGVYNVTLTATNLQGTATDQAHFTFQIGSDKLTLCTNEGDQVSCSSRPYGDHAAPGPGMGLLLAVLGLVLLARRR